MDYGGLSLSEACERVVMEKLPALGGIGGLIAVDREGNVALPFNSEGMYRAWGMPAMRPAQAFIVNKGHCVPHREELDNCEVLAVHQLNIAFQEERQFIPAVQNLSFSLRRGETLAIVGESGSGKSVTALALMRLLEQTGGQVTSERMLLRRRNRQVIDLNELSASRMQVCAGQILR